jgi:hypothetical protein
VLPFKMILNVARSGVSEFDTSLMIWSWKTRSWKNGAESRSRFRRSS